MTRAPWFLALVLISGSAAAQDMTAARRNVLQNASFTRDLSGWGRSGEQTSQQWSPLDGRNDARSGAAELRVGTLVQCVDAGPITNHRYGARVHVTGATARIEVLFLSTEHCSSITEDTIVANDSREISPAEDWRAVAATVPSGPGTRSALVKLSIQNGGDGARALFDDVFLTPTTKLSVTRIKPEQYERIVKGMPYDEVIKLLGEPSSVASDRSFAIYNYDTTLYHHGKPVTNLCAYAELHFDKTGHLTKKELTAK